jgi:hypothetical protein
VSTWRADDEVPLLRDLRRVAESRLGAIVDRRYRLADAAEIEELLRQSGFEDVRSRTLSRTTLFANGAVFVQLNAMALVGMSAAGRDMDDEMRRRTVTEIERDSMEVLGTYSRGSQLGFETATNLVTARG